MSAQHTQGRLTFKSANDGQGDCGILAGRAEDGTGPVVIAETFADIRHAGEGAAVEAAANARRLVACWNACEGVQTDMIEAAGDGLLAKALGRVGEKHDAMRFAEAQRDELLAVAENLEISGPDDDGLVWLILHGKGTTGRAMFQLGRPEQIAVQTAMHLEQDRRAAIAKVKGGAA